MVLQPPQARVCACSESLEGSSRVAQLEAQITQLKEAEAAAPDRSGDQPAGPTLHGHS